MLLFCAHLSVAQLGQPLLGGGEELPLVEAAELGVDVEVLFVEDLEDGVEQAAEGRVGGLLDNLGAGLLGVMLRGDGAQLEDVHGVFAAGLVGGAEDELELVGRHAHSPQHLGDAVAVVGDAVGHQLDRGLQIVEEAVDVGQQDRHLAPRRQVLGDLDGGHEVAAVRAAGGRGACLPETDIGWLASRFHCSSALSSSLVLRPGCGGVLVCVLTPVDLGVAPLGQDILDDGSVENLGEVLLDEG